MSGTRSRAGTAWGAAACLAAAVLLHVTGDRSTAAASAGEGLYVRSGEALKRLSLAYDSLLADVYWMRAIQYFGRARLESQGNPSYDQLYTLLDITTTLDPQFRIAYRFGAVFLAEPYPHGPGQPAAAVALLLKGHRADPSRWEYLQDIGFVYYWWLRDFATAAHWFRRAGDVPGSPGWLGPLAAVTLTKGGDRAGARALWQQLLTSGEHDYLRRIAAHRLAQLGVLDELDVLNSALARLARETGQPSTTWTPLAARGWIRADPPTDPAGVPYVLDPATGRATVSERSPYHPLPTDPATPRSHPGSPAS